MTRFCAVFGCSNRSTREKDKKFFGFPGIRDKRGRDLPEGIKRRGLWLKALRRADFTPAKIRYASICCDHFITGYPAPPNESAHPDYVPSLKLGYVSSATVRNGDHAHERHKRAKKRLLEISNEEAACTEHCRRQGAHLEEKSVVEISQESTVLPSDEYFPIYSTQSTQTEVPTADILLHEELYKLRQLADYYAFSRETFKKSDKKTLYFTGLPTYTALNSIFTRLIEPFITIAPNTVLKDKFTPVLITLMKLRLNLDFTLLAYMFKVSIQTISRLFYNTIRIMYYRFRKLIIWPSRDQLIKSMPQCFKDAFGSKICVIIDCFEIRMEKAKNLAAQSTTWSSYKSYNTVKVLIGITPRGSISYISQGYGGRISDKALTEDCGILENLLPGDVVLADRGFLIEELVGLHMAKVITPSFLGGKKQLDPMEIESTRNIAHVRIHVERVIGSLRQKYTLLHQIVPIFLAKMKSDDMAVIDQILTVCCALVNLCPSIINDD